MLYSYFLNDNGLLSPSIVVGNVLPDDFPSPCQCGKCARQDVCICRINGVKCCDFCICKGTCKNPLNQPPEWVEQSKKRKSKKWHVTDALYVRFVVVFNSALTCLREVLISLSIL